MKFTTVIKALAIGSAVIALAACSKSPNNSAQLNAKDAYASSATAHGVNSQGDYAQDSQDASKSSANQTYYFAFDGADLTPESIKSLRAQANYLMSHPNAKVRLEGNTDDRGTQEYNIGLGWRRDQSVARILEQQGVSPKQIQMVSYGKLRPTSQGEDEQAWALNRRVDLIYKVY